LDTPLSSILRPGPAAPGNDETRRDQPVDGGNPNVRPEENQNPRPFFQDDWPARNVQDPDAAARAALESSPIMRQPQEFRPIAQQPQLTRPVGHQPQEARPAAYQPTQDSRVTASYQPQENRHQPVQTAQPLAQARAATYQPQANQTQPVQPVAQQPQVSRPVPEQQPVSNDDIFAGLEAAALRDIGDDVARKAPAAEGENEGRGQGQGQGQGQGRKNRQGRQNREEDKGETSEDRPRGELTKTDRQEKRAAKLRRQEAKGKGGASLPATTTGRAVEQQSEKQPRKRDKGPKTSTSAPREWGIPWTAISFLSMVLIPAAIAAFYYVIVASPQYQVETQFAVRGSSQSSVATMGLGSLLGGTTTQTGDSYIVTSYVESLQLIRDVQQELGIDLRQFYTRDHIDWLYRIEPDMPLEKFTEYWRDMTDVSFNATTGNTTLYIYAFSAEDSKAIADAVLKVSERLVNQLSEANRQQVMQVASKQVDRAEERLRKVQAEVRKLRAAEGTTDPQQVIQIQTQLLTAMESQLSTLKTRLSALLKSVSPEAPQAKALQKQIDALEVEIANQRAQLGNTSPVDGQKPANADASSLSEVLNKFEELTIEQGFATQAYTTALAAFETAIVEAQRQERYFATFVTPTRPEIALYPMRYLDSFIAFLVLLAVWMATQFLYRSFRDHAI
jgi:capsular polysaccharide transport system permease protein